MDEFLHGFKDLYSAVGGGVLPLSSLNLSPLSPAGEGFVCLNLPFFPALLPLFLFSLSPSFTVCAVDL